jgi:chromate transporter
LAALIVFAPSFLFVLVGGPRFDQIRANASMQSFLAGAGPAVIGAIAGSAIPLGLALSHLWQLGLLGLAALWLLAFRRNVIVAIVASGVIGAIAVVAGAPVVR